MPFKWNTACVLLQWFAVLLLVALCIPKLSVCILLHLLGLHLTQQLAHCGFSKSDPLPES